MLSITKCSISDLEPVELLLTGPDRPVEILDLTGKKPACSNTELNRRETGPFNTSYKELTLSRKVYYYSFKKLSNVKLI